MEWLFRLLGISKDQLREKRIDEYRRKMDSGKTRVVRSVYYELMREEIAQRSPRQLARMQQEKGFA